MPRCRRSWVWGLIVLAAWMGGQAPALARGPISPGNPYRSFNITGVNYGSIQWERQHRGKSVQARPQRHVGGWLWRWR